MSEIDLVLIGGNVWTGVPGSDGAIARTHAVAVSGGLVVAVGDEAAALAGDAREVIDAAGATVAPGFGDGHAHPVFGGIETLFAPVRGHSSVESLVAAVGAWAVANPDAEWVRGEGYDPALAPLGEFDAAWLDAVVADRPVVLRGTDYHTAWVNSKALELAGITSATVDPIDGSISRRADGTPSGTLREWGAWRKVYDLLPELTRDQQVAAVQAASQTYSACGVVWAQDAWVEQQTVDTWLTGAEAGVLDVRIEMALLAEPGGRWRDHLATMIEQRATVAAVGTDLLSAGTVKFFADGVLEGGTAAVLEPYCNCPHPDDTGMPNWEAAELAEAVATVVAQGFQPHIHAIGDAGVRTALDAIEHAQKLYGTANRPVIAHCQLVSASDLLRFRQLGVVANFQPLWAQLDPSQTELTIPRIGAERGDRQYEIATLLKDGAPVSFGSDWPVTSPVPMRGIATAICRQTVDGQPEQGWMPHERLTLDQAMAAYTSGVAHQAGQADRWGRIAPGLRADLVLLDGDIDSLDPASLRELAVAGTWLGGRRVFGGA